MYIYQIAEMGVLRSGLPVGAEERWFVVNGFLLCPYGKRLLFRWHDTSLPGSSFCYRTDLVWRSRNREQAGGESCHGLITIKPEFRFAEKIEVRIVVISESVSKSVCDREIQTAQTV
jgi:hypothetical protein